MAVTIKQLIASTMRNFKPKLVDNIIVDSIFLAILGHRDIAPALVKTREIGADRIADGIHFEDSPGEKIQFPLMYKKNNTIQAYAGQDTLDITPQDPFTAAVYPWRSIAGSVNLANDLLDKNMGKWQIFKLLSAQLDNLKISLVDSITDFLLSPRAANSKEPFGLLDISQDDPTSNPVGGQLGELDASTETWWRNQTVDHAAAAFGTDQTGTGQINLRTLIRNCTFGNKKPNLLMGGESAFERVENTMVNQIRYAAPGATALANAGFTAITVKGIAFVMEKKIEAIRSAAGLPGDAIYALGTEFLKVYAQRKRWFEPSNMKEPSNQDTQVMHVITRLQLATNHRRGQGVMFNIPAV